MRVIIAALILMIPLSFMLGYWAGSLQDYLWEQEDDDTTL